LVVGYECCGCLVVSVGQVEGGGCDARRGRGMEFDCVKGGRCGGGETSEVGCILGSWMRGVVVERDLGFVLEGYLG
jgi:hypothetical protein